MSDEIINIYNAPELPLDKTKIFLKKGTYFNVNTDGGLDLRKWLKRELQRLNVPAFEDCSTCNPENTFCSNVTKCLTGTGGIDFNKVTGIISVNCDDLLNGCIFPNLSRFISADSNNQIVLGTDGLLYHSSVGVGTVTSVAVGDLSPLFTSTVSTPNTTPSVSFSLNTQSAGRFFASPVSLSGAPSFRSIVASDLPISISGTTNYISKFTSPTGIGNSLLYSSTSQVVLGGTLGLQIADKDNSTTLLGTTSTPLFSASKSSGTSAISVQVADGVENDRSAFFVNYTDKLWGLSTTYSNAGVYTFGIWQGVNRTFSIFNTGNIIIRTSNSPLDFVDNGYKLDVFGTSRFNNKLLITSTAPNTSGLQFTNLTSASPSVVGAAIGVDSSGNVVRITGGGGGGGSSTFIGLTDVPASFVTNSLKLVRVNASETALEFFTPTYLTANQSITFTAAGEISGSASGTTTLNPTLTVTKLFNKTLPALSTGFFKYDGTNLIFDSTTYLNANGGNPNEVLYCDSTGTVTSDANFTRDFLSNDTLINANTSGVSLDSTGITKIGDVLSNGNQTIIDIDDTVNSISLKTGGSTVASTDTTYLIANKGFNPSYIQVNDANYTSTGDVMIISFTNLSATRTLNLPAATSGAFLIVKDETGLASSSINIHIVPNGADTIDMAAFYDIKTNFKSVSLKANGTSNWILI